MTKTGPAKWKETIWEQHQPLGWTEHRIRSTRTHQIFYTTFEGSWEQCGKTSASSTELPIYVLSSAKKPPLMVWGGPKLCSLSNSSDPGSSIWEEEEWYELLAPESNKSHHSTIIHRRGTENAIWLSEQKLDSQPWHKMGRCWSILDSNWSFHLRLQHHP